MPDIHSLTLNEAIELLADAGIEDAEYEAGLIFRQYGDYSKSLPIPRNERTENTCIISALCRRAAREPLAYIFGETYLYRERYEVTPDVLIPRPDTEILIDYAVHNLADGSRFLDLCTGSGCVAISTLKNTRGTTALAVDISAPALSVAERNARINSVSDRITFLKEDVLNFSANEKFDAILSNPPYIEMNVYKGLQKEIFYEPEIAFVGGGDGADFYRVIISKYKNDLKENAFFAFEIGYDQGELLRAEAEKNALSCEIIKDLSGCDRVAVLKSR